MKSGTFSVDAHLLQELGERLVARAHIALGELIKNAYDADASRCDVEFRDDLITVIDNGLGMSEEEFLQHWMRLGTTHKVDERYSPGGRALTGSKGVGRLAVQFLAREMFLETTSRQTPTETLLAVVDWSTIKRGEDLGSVKVEWEVRPGADTYPEGENTGTKITLKGLKNDWDEEALKDLGAEVWQLRSPFKSKPRGQRQPEDFEISVSAPAIRGAKEAFDHLYNALFQNWKARIRGSLDRGRAGQSASISVEFKPDYPRGAGDEATFQALVPIPIPRRGEADETDQKPLIDRVTFEILIFKPVGKQHGGVPVAELRTYLAEFGNVSVYDSGFRLPYYGSGRDSAGHDWLNIALDQGRRLTQSELLPEHLRTQNKYMHDLPAPGRIFGAVEIDTNHERAASTRVDAAPGEWLLIQPGRDRLHDNKAYAQLRDLVRFSLDFYASRHRLRHYKAIEQRRDQEPASDKYDRVLVALEENKGRFPAPIYKAVRRELLDARRSARAEEEALDRRAALLAPLATAGMMAFALNHELSREARFLSRMESKLRRISKKHQIAELADFAAEFGRAHDRLNALRQLFGQLAEQQSATRQAVLPLVEEVVDAMRTLMPSVEFDLSEIPKRLRFPLAPPTDWSAILQNVVANAWNAMLDARITRIAFHGDKEKSGREWLRVSDTGRGLDIPLGDAHLLFEPFERRLVIPPDKRSIAIGGQGLGLAIVRMIAQRRDADVRFVEPLSGYSTTFELSWKGEKQ